MSVLSQTYPVYWFARTVQLKKNNKRLWTDRQNSWATPYFLTGKCIGLYVANSTWDWNCRSEVLLKMTVALAPAYLRVGGTMADRLIFQPECSYSPVKDKSNLVNTSYFNMTGMCRLWRHVAVAIFRCSKGHLSRAAVLFPACCSMWLDRTEQVCSCCRTSAAVWPERIAQEWNWVGQLKCKTAARLLWQTQFWHQLAAWKWYSMCCVLT